MRKQRSRKCRVAAAVMAAMLATAAMTVPSFAGDLVCSVEGERVPIAPDEVKTIQMEQSTLIGVQLQSAENTEISASNSSAVSVAVSQPFQNGKVLYSVYAFGKVGATSDIYAEDADGTKLLSIQIVDRPFVSDTTVDFQMQVGKSYVFRITPNNADDYVTFCTGNGQMLSTSVAGKETGNGKTNYYFRITALQAGTAGVYVTVGDQIYRVFSVSAVGNPNQDPAPDPDAGTKTGTVHVSGSLNIRSGPGTGYSTVGSLRNGDRVTVLEGPSNGWVKIRTAAGVTGYCSASYITISNPDGGSSSSNKTATVHVSGSLNIRSGPGTGYSTVGSLRNGNGVTVLEGPSNGWVKIRTAAGVTGYCSAEFLEIQNGSGTPSGNGSNILLHVPKYMQADPAWEDVWIGGSSGGSIRSIGCTVTCLAMTESYRTGESITPDKMVSRLSFTTGGLLYWPEGYSAVSGLSDSDLTALYKKLKSGVPVIVGGANSQTTHYAVVTGCSNVPLDSSGNPTSLRASMFTVNDPGYSDVVTLQDFLSKFPSGRSYRSY